ncbi:hypothetical protein SAMN05880501_12211 [Ureibacillus xyleni]|uniref:Prepilin-type N-terminal cleavage/methylation domain-containing protein n=1 Tax=Ureibacillus xyleni TaxID=614648 RepID=A0A285TY93_9BACL|nr:hypothetical protein [Ureibacillus xyleni]SOC27375.1 hypothetical protein SAMN05880501_12211 [Ureibacillus xyleni]
MFNSKGVTFIESLLTIAIVFIITGTLVPLSYQMYSTLSNNKMELHASITAYEAAKKILYEGSYSGVMNIENNAYQWRYEATKICVEFTNLLGERTKCINQFGEID